MICRTDLRDHLAEFRLGDVADSGVDDVNHLSHHEQEKQVEAPEARAHERVSTEVYETLHTNETGKQQDHLLRGEWSTQALRTLPGKQQTKKRFTT